MVTKNKNTFFDVNMYKTNNNIGINENDFWCLVKLNASNDEFCYEVSRESITKDEILKALDYIRNYYYNDKIIEKELTFIKNYFILIFHDIKQKKKVFELKLISLLNKDEETYSIIFEDEEIEEFIKITENFDIFKKDCNYQQ